MTLRVWRGAFQMTKHAGSGWACRETGIFLADPYSRIYTWTTFGWNIT